MPIDPPPGSILSSIRPWQLIILGFCLSILGVALPFLMVIQMVTSTFFLNSLSFVASMSGLILGIIGASQVVGRRRKK